MLSASVLPNDAATSGRTTRSCGRFGPASDGTTVPRSSDNVSVNLGSCV